MTKTIPVGRKVVVEVPATTANLGPGFDTLGMALTIHDTLTATVVDTPGIRVDVHGVGEGEVPTDETNLIARSMAHAFASKKIPVPGVHLEAHNVIPHGRGLGSSGAAIVSGVMAAKGLLEGIVEFSASELLALATDMEGHPDNIAPSLFGGLTIAWMTEEGPKHKKLSVHRGVSLVVAVPEDASMSTQLARSLQPETVPHQDAIFNLSRSALLIAALIQSPELLFEATEDRLHQNYRASAMKDTDELLQKLRSQGYPAVVASATQQTLPSSAEECRALCSPK
ncbi:MAG: homoserine kinase, partial [Pontimonas sp.]